MPPGSRRRRTWIEAARGQVAHDRGLDPEPLEHGAQRRARVGVVAVDALAEDQLVLRRVLPADELGHGDLVAVRLQRERADDVREVRAELAPVEWMREQ